MAHFVYKKNLLDEKVRDKYLDDRNTLRRAREAGIIDSDGYKHAKKQITPLEIPQSVDATPSRPSRPASTHSTGSKSSTDSVIPPVPPLPFLSSPPSPTRRNAPKLKKGSIFDRNNPMRLYKPEAQTEEQREALRAQRKEQIRQLEQYGDNDRPSMDTFRAPEEFQRHFGSISGSSTSSKPSKRRGIFRSPSFPAQDTPRNLPPVDPLFDSLSRYSSASQEPTDYPLCHASRSASVSSSSQGSRVSRTRKHSVATTLNSSASPKSPVDEPQTWADRILFGVKENFKENLKEAKEQAAIAPIFPLILGMHTPRRHSFCSQDRPLTAASRPPAAKRSTTSSLYSQERWGQMDTELPYGLSTGFDANYTPPSTLLLDLYTSLLSHFESTPRIFGYAKDEEYKASSASIAGSDIDPPHPGHLVVLDDELEETKSVLKKRAWFSMAVKWLYFGRILFSPGHHLLRLNTGEDKGRPTTGEELHVLDLDGPAIADWAWHAALEYPDAFIYVTTSIGSGFNTPVTPFTSEIACPPNQRRIQISAGHNSLSPLVTGSMDVISSRFLPAFLPKDGWLPLILECHRVLKHDGYLELSILDPVMNDMGPLMRSWILDNILSDPNHPRSFDIMPSKTVLQALKEAGFGEINKVWMWMPATSVGDELSTVTSSIGRYLYDELYCPRPQTPDEEEEEARGNNPRKHYQSEVWMDQEIMEECRKYNTAFRWLKVYVKKPSVVQPESVAAALKAAAERLEIGNAY